MKITTAEEVNDRAKFESKILTQIAAGAGAVALVRPIFGGNFAELERNVASVAGRTAVACVDE